MSRNKFERSEARERLRLGKRRGVRRSVFSLMPLRLSSYHVDSLGCKSLKGFQSASLSLSLSLWILFRASWELPLAGTSGDT